MEDDYAVQTALVPAITLDEVNEAARRFAAHRDRVVLVTGPAREGLPPTSEARLALVADSAARADLAPYTETLSDAPLLARTPAPGRIAEVDSVPEVGVIRWTLSNGARVVLKPTDFKDDEILFSATSPGGLSLLPDSAYRYGQTATAAVQLAGVGELSLTDLQKRLTGKAASVGPTVGDYSEGMNGFAAPRDVETLFQLVHLYFTQPRRDTAAWTGYLQRGREALRVDLAEDLLLGEVLRADRDGRRGVGLVLLDARPGRRRAGGLGLGGRRLGGAGVLLVVAARGERQHAGEERKKSEQGTVFHVASWSRVVVGVIRRWTAARPSSVATASNATTIEAPSRPASP